MDVLKSVLMKLGVQFVDKEQHHWIAASFAGNLDSLPMVITINDDVVILAEWQLGVLLQLHTADPEHLMKECLNCF